MEQKTESSGSTEYINDRKIDLIIKKGKERLKHAINVSVEKLTKTKKQIVKEMAVDLEKAGYPVNEISDRLTKSLKGLVGHSTIGEALDAKYKDPVKAAEAKKKENDGRSGDRNDQQLLKKPYKEVDGNDILKGVLPKSVLEKVAVYQMGQVDWWKRQLKQELDILYKLYEMAMDPEKTDAEIGKEFRAAAKKFTKLRDKKEKD